MAGSVVGWVGSVCPPFEGHFEFLYGRGILTFLWRKGGKILALYVFLAARSGDRVGF